MMFSSPFFDGYDSDPYYYQPAYRQPSRRRYLQQMRAAEEAKRRAEAHRREQARQEYLRQLQEEEAYRQAYEAAKRRREMEEARQVQQYLYGNSEYGDSDEEEEESEEEEVEIMEPVYRVMQGPYGQLYKVKVGEKPRSQPRLRRRSSTKKADISSTPSQSEDDSSRLVRGPDGRIYRVQLEQDQPKKEEPKKQQTQQDQVPSWFPRANDDAETTEEESFSTGAPSSSMRIPIRRSFVNVPRRRSSGRKKQKVTVVVEDASDSESEDEYKSAFRNRRPSPGEWMEPVDHIMN